MPLPRKLIQGFVVKTQLMRRSQLALLPPAPGGVLFLGDSITEGGMWHEWFPDIVTVNRGVGGETVAEVAARLDQVLVEPAAISLLVGTNDLGGFGESQKDEDIAAQLSDLVAELRRRCPETPLLVTSVLPRHGRLTGRVQQLNVRLKTITEQHDATYVDAWS